LLSALPAIWTPNDIRIGKFHQPPAWPPSSLHSQSTSTFVWKPRPSPHPHREHPKDIQTAHPASQPVLASGHGTRPSFIIFCLLLNLLLVCCSLVLAVFLHAKHKSGRKAFSFLLGFFFLCCNMRNGESQRGRQSNSTSF
jgi:hypothetical protein